MIFKDIRKGDMFITSAGLKSNVFVVVSNKLHDSKLMLYYFLVGGCNSSGKKYYENTLYKGNAIRFLERYNDPIKKEQILKLAVANKL